MSPFRKLALALGLIVASFGATVSRACEGLGYLSKPTRTLVRLLDHFVDKGLLGVGDLEKMSGASAKELRTFRFSTEGERQSAFVSQRAWSSAARAPKVEWGKVRRVASSHAQQLKARTEARNSASQDTHYLFEPVLLRPLDSPITVRPGDSVVAHTSLDGKRRILVNGVIVPVEEGGTTMIDGIPLGVHFFESASQPALTSFVGFSSSSTSRPGAGLADPSTGKIERFIDSKVNEAFRLKSIRHSLIDMHYLQRPDEELSLLTTWWWDGEDSHEYLVTNPVTQESEPLPLDKYRRSWDSSSNGSAIVMGITRSDGDKWKLSGAELGRKGRRDFSLMIPHFQDYTQPSDVDIMPYRSRSGHWLIRYQERSPEFALYDLTDGIELAHHSAGGWKKDDDAFGESSDGKLWYFPKPGKDRFFALDVAEKRWVSHPLPETSSLRFRGFLPVAGREFAILYPRRGDTHAGVDKHRGFFVMDLQHGLSQRLALPMDSELVELYPMPDGRVEAILVKEGKLGLYQLYGPVIR